MFAASDISDYWDKQHHQSTKALNHFIDNNPGLFAVVLSTAVETAMDVGAGTIDALRFGQGAAQGGLKGFGKDALRLMTLAGPLGRGAKIVQTAADARLARLIVDVGGDRCGWISATQALRQTGTKAFAAVEDLAKSINKTVDELEGSNLVERVLLLKQLGARIQFRSVRSWEDIGNLTKNDGSVTMFNVFGKRMENGVLKQVGHAVYAYRNNFGKLRILDRGGRAGKLGEVFESLDELGKKYGILGGWTLRDAAQMQNVFAKIMLSAGKLPIIAMTVRIAAGHTKAEQEAAAQAFEIHKVITQRGRQALEASSLGYHTVARGEWLSKIAQTFYGDMLRWPVIYEANRDVIGSDPDLIQPGQRLMIPALPRVT
jgi:hypothetical protein